MFVSMLGCTTPAVFSDNAELVPLTKVADVPLPGPAVRFDYQSLDASKGRLYIAHMNADQLVVFDTQKREVVANLDGFPNIHGVWAVPELGRVYASATGEHKVAVVDSKTLKTIALVGPVQYPDGIAYAPDAKRLFVSDEHGNADVVIDATTNSFITAIPSAVVRATRFTTRAPAISWLPFMKKTKLSRLILPQPRSLGDTHCLESRAPTALCSM